MKVNDTGSNPIQNNLVEQAEKSGKSSRIEKGSRSRARETDLVGGVSTEISTRGKELAQAKQLASAAPDIREEKIAELKKKISEGKYKVDHHAVADRMVDDHLKMHGMS